MLPPEQITHEVLRAAGYSPSTFGETNGRAPGSPLPRSSTRLVGDHRDKKTRYWSAAIGPLVGALLDVDSHVFGTAVAGAEPVVDSGDQAQPDPAELARTAQALLAAEAASTEIRVRLVHPEWDDRRSPPRSARSSLRPAAVCPTRPCGAVRPPR